MKDYHTFDAEDLAKDAFFKKSILDPAEEDTAFWTTWRNAEPQNEERYSQARLIVLAIHARYRDDLEEEEVRSRVEQMKVRLSEGTLTGRPAARQPRYTTLGWRAAAVLLLVSGVGIWLWSGSSGTWSGEEERTALVQNHERPGALITRINETTASQTIVLSDSSVATLQPGSSLTFPAVFAGGLRPVTLSGDVFFEVMHNPAAPFLVYAGETVTKVLGTRFRVTAMEKEDVVRVSVKSGRVAVFRSSEFDVAKLNEAGTEGGVLLASNEQVVFSRGSELIEKAWIMPTEEVIKSMAPPELVYDDTPVSNVFKELEQLFGMEIDFDENALASCPITTSFTDETLIDRINTICQAIGANYQLVEGKVIVSGEGCRPASD